MTTNIPLTGEFKVTCEYGRKGDWIAGYHTGVDMTGDEKIYGTCNGKLVRKGFDKYYGNYIVIKNLEDGRFHWLCHLSKINLKVGDLVNRQTVVGIMGNTGNTTGKHLHFEIRKASDKYADDINPAVYMGIPNKVGNYNSQNYQIKEKNKPEQVLKTLAQDTNLRAEPSILASKVLYLKDTTLYVLELNVTQADGYTWDKVKIRINGKEGYMINKNYK